MKLDVCVMGSTRSVLAAGPAPVLVDFSFRAMNTDVRLFAMDPVAHTTFAGVQQFFADFEARFSRFRLDSELSRLNRDAGVLFAASHQMITLLALAMTMHRRTNGVFDPCMLPALEAIGYDRSFELVQPFAAEPVAPIATAPSLAHVAFNASQRGVRLPPGARIDLGGIGKGYAVDRAIELLTPLRDLLIDAGGDIAARGHGPDGDGWVVSIADPFDAARDLAVVRLHDVSIATSSTQRRRWRRGDDVHHHLIDPRAARSVNNGLAQVSVIAPTSAEGDVFAKSALILGERDGTRLIADAGFAALFVRTDGTRSTIGRWPEL